MSRPSSDVLPRVPLDRAWSTDTGAVGLGADSRLKNQVQDNANCQLGGFCGNATEVQDRKRLCTA